MTKRAVLYARVSSDDRGKEGRNLKGQIEMCREYALERDWHIVAEISEDDRGACGALFDLPGLNRLLGMAENREFDVLVVRELDRFARSLAKQLIAEEEFQRAGVDIEYVLGEYPDTPEGNLQKNIKASVAEYERLKIKERVSRGKRQKAKAGKVLVFARCPYGYRIVDDMLTVYEPEAHVVRLIYNWYTHSAVPVRAIVRKLDEMGVPTAGDRADNGGVAKQQGYGKWCRSTVNRILSNETYAGTWYYNKWRRDGQSLQLRPRDEWIPVAVPAIVTRETWEAAQVRKQKNKELARRNRKHIYLLSGMITCGLCGARVYSLPSHGRLYYKCSRSRGEVLGERCSAPSFRAAMVDSAVWDWVCGLLMDPVALAEGLRAQQAERERSNAPLRTRLAVIDDLLADNRHQLERLLDLYLSGEFAKDALIERKTRLEATIKALEQEQRDLIAQIEAAALDDAEIESIQEFAREVGRGLNVAGHDIEAQRGILEILNVAVVLTVESGEHIAYVRCMVGDTERLSITHTSSTRCVRPPPPPPVRA